MAKEVAMDPDEARMAMDGRARTSSAAQTRFAGVFATGGSDTRESRRLAGPALTFDLDRELPRLRQEGDYGINGRNARTLVKEDGLRVVVVAAREGVEVGDAESDGALSLQVLRGHGRFASGETRVRLGEGQIAMVWAGQPWSFVADEDAGFLLTLAFGARR
jgi:quercetin dioxygenase-like cupin family protein